MVETQFVLALSNSHMKPIMTPRATPAKPSREVACEEPPQPPPGSRQVSASRKSVEGLQKLRAQVVARKTNGSEVLLKSSRTDFPPPTVPPEEDMAARNRPRNGASKEDPDEELSMWNQIKKDLEKCNVINKRAAEVSKNIKESEEKMGKCTSAILLLVPMKAVIFYRNTKVSLTGFFL